MIIFQASLYPEFLEVVKQIYVLSTVLELPLMLSHIEYYYYVIILGCVLHFHVVRIVENDQKINDLSYCQEKQRCHHLRHFSDI